MNEENNMDGCYVFPASPGQERLWFLQHYDESLGAVYNMPTAFHIKTSLDHIALQKALNTLVQRHEALRTSLVFKDGSLRQLIRPRLLKIINFVDCSDVSEYEEHSVIQEKMRQDVSRLFDMTEFGLMRLTLYQFSTSNYYLLLVIHHSVADGVSLEIFFDELFLEYELNCNGKDSTVPLPQFQYVDITEWNREWYDTGEYLDHAAYWKEKLEMAPYSINMPTQSTQGYPDDIHFIGHAKHFYFEDDFVNRIKQVAKATGTTDYAVLFSAFSLLIHYYSGQRDFLVGVPVANRPREEMNHVIGFLANTVVIRVTMDDDTTVRELIKQIHKTTTEAVAYQRYPYRDLHELLKPQRHANSNSLFQLMFGFQDVPNELFKINDKPIDRIPVKNNFSRFDFSIFLFNENNAISGFIEYKTALYKNETIDTMIKYFYNICIAFDTNIDNNIDAIQCYSDAERQKTLELLKAVGSNGTLNIQLASVLQSGGVTITPDSLLKLVNRENNVVAPDMVGELLVDGQHSGIHLRLSHDGSVTHVTPPTNYLTLDTLDNEQVFVAAQGDTETMLEVLWQRLLARNGPISVNSSFFSLGGHSLLVAKMVDLVAEHFKVVVPMKDIFFNPTISHIAKKIDFLCQGIPQEEASSSLLDSEKQQYMEIMVDFI